jgi:hypothetical protein
MAVVKYFFAELNFDTIRGSELLANFCSAHT